MSRCRESTDYDVPYLNCAERSVECKKVALSREEVDRLTDIWAEQELAEQIEILDPGSFVLPPDEVCDVPMPGQEEITVGSEVRVSMRREGETTRTSTDAEGNTHTFTKVNHETLGEGWRDPSGLIWFDRAEDRMNHRDAKAYCQERGGRLPTKKEFQQLGLYMGANGKVGNYDWRGYQAQVLPNLKGYDYWSSSVRPDFSVKAYIFDYEGYIASGSRNNDEEGVRCVAE